MQTKNLLLAVDFNSNTNINNQILRIEFWVNASIKYWQNIGNTKCKNDRNSKRVMEFVLEVRDQ
jgi:hypothetical protein